MVGSGDHRPSLSQVAGTVSPLQVKLSVDPTSAGSGGAPTMVTLFAWWVRRAGNCIKLNVQ